MWPAIAITCLIAAVTLHWWWWRRYKILETVQIQWRRAHSDWLKNNVRQELQIVPPQMLFNTMVDSVLLLDDAGRIALTNPALEKLLSVSEPLRGRTVMEAFRWRELTEVVDRALQTGQVQAFEMQPPGMANSWLLVNASALRAADGKLQGTLLVFHDFTRIRQLENTRQEFVANVSHELRTPLSLIQGYTETLLDGAINDPQVSARFLQTISKNTARLTFLIEDLLTISQLESGKVMLQLQTAPLGEAVSHALEDLRSRAEAKKIQINIQIPDDLAVRADLQRLHQVLMNLIDNAIKYGRVEGHVWIGAQPRPDRDLEIWVRDDGPGIPLEARHRVFERFFRVDKARSREHGGTGLGLAIVKHIVQAHGGNVWLDSEMGQGSTFHFTLPQN